MVDDEIVPISRIAPLTMPGVTWATEQSTLLSGSALNFTSVPTLWAFSRCNPRQ